MLRGLGHASGAHFNAARTSPFLEGLGKTLWHPLEGSCLAISLWDPPPPGHGSISPVFFQRHGVSPEFCPKLSPPTPTPKYSCFV